MSDDKPHELTSEDILRGDREVLVDHDGVIYKLRLTNEHKLILNKPDDRFPSAATIRTIKSADLLNGEPQVVIRHGDDAYRVAVTKTGKLIMVK